MYHAVLNSDFDLGEIPTYEDVELLPPNSIHKRPLVLIGNLIIEEFVNIKYRKVVDIKCTVGKKKPNQINQMYHTCKSFCIFCLQILMLI